ncbi:hypothetical protein DXG01_010118 [Tephrocybe rancida]|nr:hypothetical protein DXG01_010118 [Tephrocybe rancida]
MKNTLIRAVNNLYDLAPHIHNKEDLEHFLRYATMLFFNGKNSQGATLVACLGIEDTTAQDFTLLINVTNGLQQNLHVWAKAPESYSHSALRSSLSNVAKVMLPGMANQASFLILWLAALSHPFITAPRSGDR